MTGSEPLPGAFVDPACPVEWSHPLNRGLVAEWTGPVNAGWRGGAAVRDLTRRFDMTLTAGTPWTPADRVGLAGPTFDGSTTCDAVTARATTPALTAITLACVLKPAFSSSSSGTAYSVFHAGYMGDESNKIFLRWELTRWIFDSASSCRYDQDAPVAFAAGDTVFLTFAGTGFAAQYYREGQPAATSTVVSGTAFNDTSPYAWQLGRFITGDARRFNGTILKVGLYDRVLSAGQVAALYDQDRRGNPERWRWVGRRTWFPGTAVSPPPPPPAVGAPFYYCEHVARAA